MIGPEALRLTWFFPLCLVAKQLPKVVCLVSLSVCVHGGSGPAPVPHMIPLLPNPALVLAQTISSLVWENYDVLFTLVSVRLLTSLSTPHIIHIYTH